MQLKDFDYDLPESLIPQFPLKDRASSRLMALDRSTGEVRHKRFTDIKEFFRPGDLLVLNDTRVIPARLAGSKSSGGKAEAFLIRRLPPEGLRERWECLLKPSKGLKSGSRFYFDEGMEAEVMGKSPEGHWICGFSGVDDFSAYIERVGKIPLPPYIKREAAPEDKEGYQTVFAGSPGAVAAPTAGLHFTLELLDELKKKEVEICLITLHTGPGTFMPVRVDNIEEHRMSKEFYSIGKDAFGAVLKAKGENRRVIAAGTTSTRALESSVLNGFESPALAGSTGLFIYPGFEFRVIDGLITNFHLPGSTLIMLASAFAGRRNILNAYRVAVEEGYRFFSYGDAMLIL